MRVIIAALVAAFSFPISAQQPPLPLPYHWSVFSAYEPGPGVLQPDLQVRTWRPDLPVDWVTITSDGTRPDVPPNSWVWSFVGCHLYYGCPIDILAPQEVILHPLAIFHVEGPGMARGVIQLQWDDGHNSWEIDINVAMTPSWPIWDNRVPYVWAAPLGTYPVQPNYYVVINGKWGGWSAVALDGQMEYFNADLLSILRKVNADNPVLFPVPPGGWASLRLVAYGVSVEARGDARATVTLQDIVIQRLPVRIPRRHLTALPIK